MKYLLILPLLVTVISCTRATKDSSSISVALPQSVTTSEKLSGQTVTEVLEHVVINVTGPNIEKPILFTWDSCRECANPPPPPTSFVLDIPMGDSRLIQVLAVYKNQNVESMSFWYGDATKKLANLDETVAIALGSIGGASNVISGVVSGRLLGNTGSGPSGEVEVRYRPINKPPMLIERDVIINGWFSLFALAGAPLEYYLVNSGQVLFGGPVDLNSPVFDPGANSGANFTRILKAFIPSHKREEYDINNNPQWVAEEAKIYVWGYFGDPTAISGKTVCRDFSTGLTRVKKYDESAVLSVNELSTAGGVVPTVAELLDTMTSPMSTIVTKGGVDPVGAPCNNILDSDKYTNVLQVSSYNIDGNGSDNAPPFREFLRILGTGMPIDITSGSTGYNISGHVLPGVKSIIQSIRFFKKVLSVGDDLGVSKETVNCHELTSLGFSDLGDSVIDANDQFLKSDVVSFSQVGQTAVVFCPIVSGTMLKRGALLEPWVFGGGGGGSSGPAVGVEIFGLSAVAPSMCREVRGHFVDSNSNVTMNTTATNIALSSSSSVQFYDSTDINCDTPIATVPVAASEGEFRFRIMSTDTVGGTANIALATTEGWTYSLSVPVRSTSDMIDLRFSYMNEYINQNHCQQMYVKAYNASDGIVATVSGTVVVSTMGGIAPYSDAGCTAASSNISMSAGVASFYVKSGTLGWQNVRAQFTDAGVNFETMYGLEVVNATDMTGFTISDVNLDNNYMSAQCLEMTMNFSTSTGSPVNTSGEITAAIHSGSGNFYTDPSCSVTMGIPYNVSNASSQSIYFLADNNTGATQTLAIELAFFETATSRYFTQYYNQNIEPGYLSLLAPPSYLTPSSCTPMEIRWCKDSACASGAQNISGPGVSLNVGMDYLTGASLTLGTDYGIHLDAGCSSPQSYPAAVSIPNGFGSVTVWVSNNYSGGTSNTYYLSVWNQSDLFAQDYNSPNMQFCSGAFTPSGCP